MQQNVRTIYNSLDDVFEHAVSPPQKPEGHAFWFIFFEDELLVEKKESVFLPPKRIQKEELPVPIGIPHYIGSYQGIFCYCAAAAARENPPVSGLFDFQKLRMLFQGMEEAMFALASRAYQIVTWSLVHRFCGNCGSPTQYLHGERAMHCSQCHLSHYPRISPAVLVAVMKGDAILLARSRRFVEPRYSLIAGFVEPGETLEQCVNREVKEETGINISNIEYFSSQPWPFSHSLMIAFTARYKSGQIIVDNNELVDARWFTKDNLPLLPDKLSLSRILIDWLIRSQTALG
jgi:NAD+ diphosphatase